MRIIHTSDWHLGMPVGTGTLEEDQRFFLEQFCEILCREEADAVLLAGDVYDSSVASAGAIALYNEAATRICGNLHKTLVVIAGNHDGAARLAACRELLKGAGLHVTGRLTRDVEPVLFPGERETAVYPLPFFHRDEAAALFPERREEIRSQETAMRVVCDHIRETMDPERFNIVMAHALIVNAELSDSDRSARVGFASAVSREVFDGFDYVALGHIHKPQRITERIRYSGSPLQYSFGAEEKQTKCVLLLDTDTGEVREIPLRMRRGRRTLTGTWEEILAREDAAGDYLRLFVTDRYAGLELLAQARERFPWLLEFYGKSLEEQGDFTALTVEELRVLDETDIMKKFCEEQFGYQPDAEQEKLFREALAAAEKEGELS